MSFTTRCFIRKNSKELQERLADIGYSICRCANFTNVEWLNTLPINGTVHGKGYFDAEMEFPDWTVEKELSRFVSDNPSSIDCGTNEELFLAIAALRDDSNENQWFVWDDDGDDDDDESDKFKKFDDNINWNWWIFECHKATVEELIKHFTQ